MADNSTQNGSDNIATDDLATLNGSAVGAAVKIQRNKVAFGNDGDARDVSSSFPLPVQNRIQSLTQMTGSITASGQSVTATTDIPNAGTATVFIYGTFSATLIFEMSPDGTVWAPVNGQQAASGALTTVGSTGAISGASSTVGVAYDVPLPGPAQFRVRCTAYTSGTVLVSICPATNAFEPAPTVIVSGTVTVDTEMPAAGAPGDGASPTVPGVETYGTLFNNATWDRQRSNYNTTTGDTGAKTATGNGATQTNYNGKGVYVLFNIGTVSGTTPTCVFKLQGSADSGTTWFDIPGAATTSITATGTYLLAVYPGPTAVANSVVSLPLPRTWRTVWTIGGTTPSFAITNVQVAYVN